MATAPALIVPSHASTGRASGVTWGSWVPPLLCILFVGCTSNSINSGYHTQKLVDYVWRSILGGWHDEWTGVVNEAARKSAHFLGYGVIGLIFRSAFSNSSTLRRIGLLGRRLSGEWMVSITALSIFSAFIIAFTDEMHQRFVPQRVGCFRDVMVDCAGALFMIAIYWTVPTAKRRTFLQVKASA